MDAALREFIECKQNTKVSIGDRFLSKDKSYDFIVIDIKHSNEDMIDHEVVCRNMAGEFSRGFNELKHYSKTPY